VTRTLRLSLLLALLLAGLGARSARAADDASSPLVEPTPFSDDARAQVNASAHGLAGLASPGESKPWESSPDWQSYQDYINGRWAYLNRVRLHAKRTWSASALHDLRRLGTVYYPFSGPDILYVDTLFPDSKYLIMGGLEPIGTMPDLAQLRQDGRLPAYLQQIRTSLYTVLAASFFKTKDMKNDFSGQVDGILPAMALFIAHQGYTIDSIHYVTLHPDGTLTEHAAAGANGVQIGYDDGDRDDLRYALYFKTDLGNDGVHDNPGYVNLMHRLGAGVTYLKAASYLLYDDYFSRIRDAILANSIAVVEDDSGVPYRYFEPAKWEVTPYGNYTGPINLFKDKNQPDLAAFYAKNIPSPLPFGTGYKFVPNQSSILVARKKE
jgi:hypothetical protein